MSKVETVYKANFVDDRTDVDKVTSNFIHEITSIEFLSNSESALELTKFHFYEVLNKLSDSTFHKLNSILYFYVDAVAFYINNCIKEFYKLNTSDDKYYNIKKNQLCYKLVNDKYVYLTEKTTNSNDLFDKLNVEYTKYNLFLSCLVKKILNDDGIKQNSIQYNNYRYDIEMKNYLKEILRKIKIKGINYENAK